MISCARLILRVVEWQLEHRTCKFLAGRFPPLWLFRILSTVNPSPSVLVQIGVRAQLQRQIGDVNLNEGQGLIQREELLLTQQETH